jgi:hypothetical protein
MPSDVSSKFLPVARNSDVPSKFLPVVMGSLQVFIDEINKADAEIKAQIESVVCSDCKWRVRYDESKVMILCPCIADKLRLQCASYEAMDMNAIPSLYGIRYRIATNHEWNPEV